MSESIPQSEQPIPTAAAAPMGAAQTPGPPGKGRSTALVILVSIVSFGIWIFVWSFQNGEELKKHNRTGLGGAIYLILTIVFAPITMFMVADEIDKMYTASGKKSPVTALTGLWVLLPFIGNIVWYVKVQGALNDHWESLGAAPAAGI
jgi:hypothetical protein